MSLLDYQQEDKDLWYLCDRSDLPRVGAVPSALSLSTPPSTHSDLGITPNDLRLPFNHPGVLAGVQEEY